jgi:hypothetical protein
VAKGCLVSTGIERPIDPQAHRLRGGMPGSDLFLQTIDAVYASGLDSARLPLALEATSRLLGDAGAILEVIEREISLMRQRAYDLACD